MRARQGGVVGGPIPNRDGAYRLAALLTRLRQERPDIYPAVISIVRSLVYKT